MPDTEPQAGKHIANAIARAAGALAAILGLIALAGWIFGLPVLASLGRGWIPMAPSTALLSMLFGAAIFSTARTSPSRTAQLVGIVIGSSGALFALLLFILSYQGIHPDIEHLGLTISGTLDHAPLGHMSPVTALCFLLTGLSLAAVLRSYPDRAEWTMAGFWLAAVLTLACTVFLLAYLIGKPLLYGGKFIPPALTTIIVLTALGAALLAIAKPRAWAASRQIDAETRSASHFYMLIFLLMALGLFKVGSIYYENDVNQQRASIERELSAVADLKVEQLVKWRGERLGDAALLYGNPAFAALVQRALGSPHDAQSRDQLDIWLYQIRESFGYAEIHLIDAQGIARFSVPDISPNARELDTARHALRSNKVSLDDFHVDQAGEAPHLTLLVPIFEPVAGGRPLGVVMLEVDPGRNLYPLIELWPTQSPSAETLLVRRDGDNVQYLNQLRYRKNTALTLHYPLTEIDKPAVKAVLGQEGIVEGTDYRGVPIIAALRKVPDTPWFLLTRMDKDEFLASIQSSLWLTAGIIAVLLLAAGMALSLIGRQQRLRHYAERVHAAEELASSAARYRAVVQTAPDAIVTADSSGIIVKWNPGAERMFGYAETEIIGQPLTLLMPERFHERHLAGMKRVQSGGEQHVIGKATVELAGRRKDASEFPIDLSLAEWSVGEYRYFTGIIRDITERKAAEAKILRHTQLYAALSQCNEAIVRSTDEEELFPRICRIAVEFGGMKMAWIGLVDPNTSIITAVATFGDHIDEYLQGLEVTADPGKPLGRGPTGTAARENRPVWCQDFQIDPIMAPWRERAAPFGIKASAALPLSRNGTTVGTITLYADETNAFDEQAQHLLLEMTRDIDFALETFVRESQRRQAELALARQKDLYDMLSQTNQTIVRVTSREELFQAVCRIAVEHGRFRFAWIGLIEQDDPQLKVAARYGTDTGYIDQLDLQQDGASRLRKGLTGQIILSGAHVISNDFLHDPAMAPWHEVARRAGVRAAAKFPIRQGDAVIGAINLYADDLGFFSQELVATLDEMALDISFALDNYAREAARMKAEKDLREAEKQFRGLVEQGIAGSYIIQDDKFAYVNPRFAEIFGYESAAELIGRNILSLVAEKDRGVVAENIRTRIEGHEINVAYEFTALRKDGSIIEVGVHGMQANYKNRPAVIGLIQDISEKKRAEEAIQHYIGELKTAFMGTVEVATIMSELRDPYTAGHERRVAEIAVAIGAELGLDENRQEGLKVAGSLHDIGKINIPSEILSKPGKLSAIEYQLIQGHPQAGYDVLKSVEFPWPVAQVALQHHERINGSGYPQGLKGEEILFEARIMAVADVVEAISSHRPYRPGMGIDKALAEIERGRGSAYDPVVADACLRLFRERGYTLPA
ncbi:MAG: PAS domain S-box protein [Georgfuchsia sp.]